MHGACRLVGIGPPVLFDGDWCDVHARTVRDYAAIEARMLQMRGNPFDVLRWLGANGYSSRFIEKCIFKVNEGWWNVTELEVLEWLQTWEGRIVALSLAIRRDYGSVKRFIVRECDKALISIGQFGPEQWWMPYQEAIDMANGDDEAGSLELMAKAGEEESGGIRWELVYKILCSEPHGMSTKDVETMNLRQVIMLCGKQPEIKTSGEALQYEMGRKLAAERATRNILDGKHWNSL